MTSGSVLKEDEKECKWYLKEKLSEIEEIPDWPYKISRWAGKYTGRVYCTIPYCERNAITSKSKTFISYTSCPHVYTIDNNCPLIETARESEAGYTSKRK